MSTLPPELLRQLAALGGQSNQRARLSAQAQMAEALRRGSGGRQYTSPVGAALGGLADVGGALGGALLQQRAMSGLEGLDAQAGRTRSDVGQAFMGAEQAQRQGEAAQLLTSRPVVPFAGPEYEAGTEALRQGIESQGEPMRQQRRQDFGQAALLSGDPALTTWGKSLLSGGEGGDTLAAQRLQQGEERLSLMKAAEERRAQSFRQAQGFREQQARTQREQAERKAATKKVEDSLKLEEGLRKEVVGSPAYKSYVEALMGLEKVQSAAKENSAAGDIALVFGLMKTLDPGSTVREGEQAQAQQATGVPGQILNVYNRLLTGERLSPEQRADFSRTARNQFGAHEAAFQRHVDFYKGVGSRAGANLANVIPGAAQVPAPSAATPAQGAAPPAAAPAGKVRIRLPDGSEKLIPADKVEEAQRDYKATVL